MKIRIFTALILLFIVSNAKSQDGAWPGLNLGTLSCSGSPYAYTGITTGSGNDCSFYSTGGDHIYQFSIANQSDVTIDLCGSAFDTYLLLYNVSSGSCTGGPLTFNDDACGLQSSITQTGLNAGTYVVIIEGYGGATGAYNLNISVSNCIVLTPMSFVSCTANQPNTSVVSISSTNQEIIRMEVVTTGTTSPLSATQFLIRTDGTTNIADIANAKIWYTGTSNTYSNTVQFGSTIAVPLSTGLDMIFNGVQTLLPGTNYFWLSYDIKPGATIGNFVDGKFQQTTISAMNNVPTISTPAGNRQIANTCNHTIRLTDTFGDGWNGGTVSVSVNGSVVLTNISMSTSSAGPEDFTFSASSGSAINVTRTNAGSFPSEMRIEILDGNNNSVLAPVEPNSNDATGACPTPMVYVSSTVTQNNNFNVPKGLTNQEIICLKVVTSGGLTPFDITSFNIKMTGTTNIADVSNIKIFYTGSVSTYSAINQFGSAIPATGTITINGSRTLLQGNNYFWISYDIAAGAIINNYVDAECNQIVLSGGIGTKVPTIQNPNGRRKIIALSTCTHKIRLYDFNNQGWGTDNVDVLVDGVPVLIDQTLSSGANGVTYTFSASEGQTISTVYSGFSSESMYVITGGQGDFILEDGVENTVPTGKTALASCVFQPKFTINGNGYYNGESVAKTNANGNCITLTDEIQGMYSTAWHNTKVDLSNNFQIKFDLNFGDRSGFGVGGGADGIAFVLQDKCINAGISGSGIGFGGITPSVAVEFDTYENGVPNNDPWVNHASVFKNGNNTHSSSDELTAVYSYPATNTLLTGLYRSYTVDWNSVTKTLRVFDGSTQILSYTGDIVTNIFGGIPDVYWGFSSATGESTNHHRVKVTTYPSATASSALADVSIVSGASIQALAAQGGATYLWSPGTGVSNVNIYNPIFSPTVTTTYTVIITDDCGNTMTDDFTITVFGSLPVEMMEFAVTCSTSSVDLNWRTASETNSNYFVVERGTNEFDFKEIGKIKSAGNSNQIVDYYFKDIDPIRDVIIYYRLKQVDIDESYTYTDLVVADCIKTQKLEVNIYSGTGQSETNIIFSKETEQDFILEIFDYTSRLILKKIIPAGVSSFMISEAEIAYGTYIFRIYNKNERFVKKVIK